MRVFTREICGERRRNVEDRRERCKFENDIRPVLIVSNRAADIRAGEKWRRSTPLPGTLRRRDKLVERDVEFARDLADF